MKTKRKERVTLKNIFYYLQGNFRYSIFYSRYFYWLMRDHIREQIEWRIRSMDKRCFENGSCYLCGCQTTHLQMANKPCRKPCYPKMLNKKAWNMYIKRDEVWIDGKLWSFDPKLENFVLLK